MKCEACNKETANSLSTLNDSDWIIAGMCTQNTERYYVMLKDIATPDQYDHWLNHLRGKIWFIEQPFRNAYARLSNENA